MSELGDERYLEPGEKWYLEPEEGRYLEPDKERNLGPGEESHLGLAADSRYTSSQRDRPPPQQKCGNRRIGSESAEYNPHR